ncbi:N-acetylmuramoyl-L-alanine amidase [Paramagnetospirillum magnetotacticum MS-1]|uniref:N-acetylmuramoyl-L-alanine amidase n=1 Tax=Paramagnetospirillum magnetotacticum MS-1 TaxID=272627 RepID=A0A0C2YSA1_PARME|nr:N-acetylmuramoyl-L-alanine amidase [Paramagnetospirillum magnetotacticum]KIL97580.1 N-acetylmuramoyl-L-alanine amidase [Paramagnetospirillum magnetotacticum MS-1]
MRLFCLLLLVLLPQPVLAGCLIALDVGHYQEAPGEISARGVPELVFNTELARRVGWELDRHGIAWTLINGEGDIADLAERPRRAAQAGASLFLSLHHDSVQDIYKTDWVWQGVTRAHSEVFSGFGLFVSAANPRLEESLRVAQGIADSLLVQGLAPSLHHGLPVDGENRPLLDSARGIYRFDGLAVLRQAVMPAVLIEAGIIVNRDDEVLIASEPYRAAFARAITAAAAAHCQGLN